MVRAWYRGPDSGPSSPELELFINEKSVGVLNRAKKKSELERDSRYGDVVPNVTPGDTAEVWIDIQIMGKGQFVED